MNFVNWFGHQRYDDGGKEAHKEKDDGEVQKMYFRDDDRSCVFLPAAWASIPKIKPHSNGPDQQTNHEAPERSLLLNIEDVRKAHIPTVTAIRHQGIKSKRRLIFSNTQTVMINSYNKFQNPR